ncbi:MAG: DUF2207 domain-containing protein [Anaerobacillus sp.]
MRLKPLWPVMLIIIFFLFPISALAVDYTISNTAIDVHLHKDGTANITEHHTYAFEGEFNGITRTLIPNKDSQITDFKASESGKDLKVEKEEGFYKIYRGGEDEKVTVDLSYMIENAVVVYEDVAKFHWSFFDSGNESDYQNFTVTIFPPKATPDVIAYGLDEAYGKEEIMKDGTVVFRFGEVPANKNGDVTVGYEPEQFAEAPTIRKIKKDEMIAEKEALKEKATIRLARQEQLSSFASVTIPILSAIVFVFMLFLFIKSRQVKVEVEKRSHYNGVPEQDMSLPATIYFANYRILHPEAIAAALLDLVRKGVVKEKDAETYVVESRIELERHEEILVEWLFDEIGENNVFTFKQLKEYTEDQSNHKKYQLYQSRWQAAVAKEVRDRRLYQDLSKLRIAIGLSSLLIVPLIIVFFYYGLYLWAVLSIGLFLVLVSFASFYKPKTWEGAKMYHDWKMFKLRSRSVKVEQWKGWSEDDRMRAFLFCLGVNNKAIREHYEQLMSQFNISGARSDPSNDMTSMLMIAALASSGFQSANASAAPYSGTAPGSGTGGAGGGGGSGAF